MNTFTEQTPSKPYTPLNPVWKRKQEDQNDQQDNKRLYLENKLPEFCNLVLESCDKCNQETSVFQLYQVRNLNRIVQYYCLSCVNQLYQNCPKCCISQSRQCGNTSHDSNWDALCFAHRCFENNIQASECRTIEPLNSADVDFIKDNLKMIKKLSSCYNTLQKHLHFVER